MTQLNLVEQDHKKRNVAPRPKAEGNQHLKDLEALGFDAGAIAESFGLDKTTVSKYLSGANECPAWTVLAARQLKSEIMGRARMFLIAPTKDDEGFVKDLLKRSGIQYKELEF